MGKLIENHVNALKGCRRCPDMHGPVVTGVPVSSKIMLVGQAPGNREGAAGKPFAWTAGKTLFGWFSRIGVEEDVFRHSVYMAAVCRCFPGKKDGGGDRVPSTTEIENCSHWLNAELNLLKPALILPVGKLAISLFRNEGKLTELVGREFPANIHGHDATVIPLPHPSGASPWHRMEPGKSLLSDALDRIQSHSAWQSVFASRT